MTIFFGEKHWCACARTRVEERTAVTPAPTCNRTSGTDMHPYVGTDMQPNVGTDMHPNVGTLALNDAVMLDILNINKAMI